MNIITAAKNFVADMRLKGWLHMANVLPRTYGELTAAIDSEGLCDAVIEGNLVRCPRCGLAETLPLPINITALGYWVAYFHDQHRHCDARRKLPDVR